MLYGKSKMNKTDFPFWNKYVTLKEELAKCDRLVVHCLYQLIVFMSYYHQYLNVLLINKKSNQIKINLLINLLIN